MSNDLVTKLPQTVSELQLTIRSAIEYATKNPYSNQNKLNDALAVGLGLSNYNALKPRLNEIEPIKHEIRNDGQILIDDEFISDEVFTERMSYYELFERTETIKEFTNLIAENLILNNENLRFTLEQLNKLNTSNDKYVLVHCKTNRVYCPSIDTAFFNQECNHILEASGYGRAEIKTSNKKLNNNKSIADLIINSPTLIKEANVFITTSYMDGEYLNIFFSDDLDEFNYEFNIETDTFKRNGNGSFTLKSEEYGDLEIILFSPMNI